MNNRKRRWLAVAAGAGIIACLCLGAWAAVSGLVP